MKKYDWDAHVEGALAKMMSIFPEVVRERSRQRIVYNAEKIAAHQGTHTISFDIFWQSAYEVLPGGYDPLLLREKDPEKMKEEGRKSRAQEEIPPGEEPVALNRWGKNHQTPPQGICPKKVLALTSSARKGGNTDVLVDEMARALRENGCEVEKLYLSDLNIKPCTGCRACRLRDVKTICAIKDDMTPIYEEFYAPDGIDGFPSGFPIYTARENGIMANFMDRWDCISNPYQSRKIPEGKKAVVICTWMWPNPSAYDYIVEHMVMLIRLHHLEVTDALTLSGTRGKRHGKGVVKNHPDILKRVYDAGVDFLKAMCG